MSDSWGHVKLKDISEKIMVGIASSATHAYVSQGIRLIRNLNIKENRIDDSDLIYISEDYESQHKNKRLKSGDILTVRTGYPGVSAVLPKHLEGSQCFTSLVVRLNQDKAIPEYVCQYINSELGKKFISESEIGGAQKNVNAGTLENLPLFIPEKKEQQRILEILSTWDKSIEATEQLLENSKKRKKALMQQLLNGKKRLPGFGPTKEFVITKYGEMPSDWKFTKILDFASQKSLKANDEKVRRVLSCSKHEGFVDSLSYFKKQVFSEDTSNYKVIKRNWFGFPANHIEEGSIGLQNVCDEGIVSPIYIVFALDEKKCMPEYLYPILKTEHYRQIFAASTNASVDRRGSLRWDGFGIIKIALPSLKEQEAISAVISTAQRQISTLERKLTALKEEKKALMQQLLTGKKRVKVEEAT